MELARRDLINAARNEMVTSKDFVDDVPVGRPSPREFDELFDSSDTQLAVNHAEEASS